MLRLNDSANFSRTLAAVCLVAGPLLLAVSNFIDPAWADDPAEYLSEVAAAEGAYIAAGVISTIGTLLFVAGMLGVIRLLRRRGVTVGQFGAGLLTVGLMGLVPSLAFNGLDVIMARAENREVAAAISESAFESAALGVYFIFFFYIGILLGTLLLVIGLFRQRIVTIWSPILLIAAIALGYFANGALVNGISFLILTLALFPVAMRIWNLSDEQWRQWEVPLETRTDVGGAPSGP